MAERTRLVLQVAQELRYNHEWLSRLALAHRNKDPTIPVGSLKTDALIALIQRHHDWVVEEAYGEEKYLYQLAFLLQDLSIRLGSPSTIEQVTKFNADSNYSMHDGHFLNNFIFWYLTPFIQNILDERQYYSLGWFGLPSNAFSIEGVPVIEMKHFVTDGLPITEYSDYLFLID